MSERLPMPVIAVEFEASATLPDCLRAALNHARRLQVGMSFRYSAPEALQAGEYTVLPWMSLEDVLALWDEAQARSVRDHQGVHGG